MQAVDRLSVRTYLDSEAKLHGSPIGHAAASSDATLVPSLMRRHGFPEESPGLDIHDPHHQEQLILLSQVFH